MKTAHDIAAECGHCKPMSEFRGCGIPAACFAVNGSHSDDCARLTAAIEARDAEWNRRTPAAPPELRCDCYETGETEKTCCPCVCHKPAATPGTAPTPPSEPGDRGGEG